MRSTKVVFAIYLAAIGGGLAYSIVLGVLGH
jgi:hypothetical protein